MSTSRLGSSAEPSCMARACCSCPPCAASYSWLLVMVCRGWPLRVEVPKLALPKSLSCLLGPQVLKDRVSGPVRSLCHLQHVRQPWRMGWWQRMPAGCFAELIIVLKIVSWQHPAADKGLTLACAAMHCLGRHGWMLFAASFRRSRAHLFLELCTQLQTFTEGAPVLLTIIHIAPDVIVSQLVGRSCRNRGADSNSAGPL